MIEEASRLANRYRCPIPASSFTYFKVKNLPELFEREYRRHGEHGVKELHKILITSSREYGVAAAEIITECSKDVACDCVLMEQRLFLQSGHTFAFQDWGVARRVPKLQFSEEKIPPPKPHLAEVKKCSFLLYNLLGNKFNQKA